MDSTSHKRSTTPASRPSDEPTTSNSLSGEMTRIDERHVGTIFQHAESLHDQGKLDEAVEHYDKVLHVEPNHIAAQVNKGIALKNQGRFAEAADCYRVTLEIEPDLAEAHINLGIVLTIQDKLDAAISSFSDALELKPNNATAHLNLGIAYKKRDAPDRAEVHFRRALEIDPNCAEAHNNLGSLLNDREEFTEAISFYKRALQLEPNYAEAHDNLGIAQQETGNLAASIESFSRAIELQPDYIEARFNRSLVLLLNENFEQGWQEYEWRSKHDSLRPDQFDGPAWDGSSLTGKTILICGEQGVGEEILFASCIPEVMDQAKQCLIECDERLVPLFARSFPSAQIFPRPADGDPSMAGLPQPNRSSQPSCMMRATCIHSRMEDSEPDIWLPRYDLKIGTGSLPRFLRPNVESFPRVRNFLVPNPQLCEMWRSRFRKFGPSLKVGISWRGGKTTNARQRKSTTLDQWSPILSLPGITFVNLQYGNTDDELAEIQKTLDTEIHDWNDADPLTNLESFAAQVSSLDLVISVSNTTVHMAGAMGVPVWTMLPHVPDWRWQMHRDDCLWYSTMRLFRQPQFGDWESTIQNVSHHLQQIISPS